MSNKKYYLISRLQFKPTNYLCFTYLRCICNSFSSTMFLLLQICMQLSFKYFIYIPPKFKNVHDIITKNTQCNSNIYFYLHLTSHTQVRNSYYSFFFISPKKMKYFFQNYKCKTLPKNWGYIVGGLYHTLAK